jgi:hypothetical protein
MKDSQQQHIAAELRELHARIEHLKVRLQGADTPTVNDARIELQQLEDRCRALSAHAPQNSSLSRVGQEAGAILDKAILDLKQAIQAASEKVRK